MSKKARGRSMKQNEKKHESKSYYLLNMFEYLFVRTSFKKQDKTG